MHRDRAMLSYNGVLIGSYTRPIHGGFISNDLEWLKRNFNDTEHRAVSLRQLNFLSVTLWRHVSVVLFSHDSLLTNKCNGKEWKWNDNSVNYDRPVHHELTLAPHTFSITGPSFQLPCPIKERQTVTILSLLYMTQLSQHTLVICCCSHVCYHCLLRQEAAHKSYISLARKLT